MADSDCFSVDIESDTTDEGRGGYGAELTSRQEATVAVRSDKMNLEALGAVRRRLAEVTEVYCVTWGQAASVSQFCDRPVGAADLGDQEMPTPTNAFCETKKWTAPAAGTRLEPLGLPVP